MLPASVEPDRKREVWAEAVGQPFPPCPASNGPLWPSRLCRNLYPGLLLSCAFPLGRTSWSGPVPIYETDDRYLLSPGPSSLLSPLGGLSLSSRTVFGVYARPSAGLTCVTSALGRLADASRFTGAYCPFSVPFPQLFSAASSPFTYFCIPVFGVMHTC